MRMTQISVSGVAASAWLPVDFYTNGGGLGLYLDVGAGSTVSVEITPDNVLDPAVTPTAWPCGIAALTAATADAAASLTLPCKAVRLNQTVAGAATTLKAVQAGLM